MTATDETRVHPPAHVLRWGVVCGDGGVVWARDESAARRLLVSLVGAIRLVCEEAGDPSAGPSGMVPPGGGGPGGASPPPVQRAVQGYPG